MAAAAPSSSSAVKSAAYDTDSVDPLASEIGRFTFHADVKHAASSRNANSHGCGNATAGRKATPTPGARGDDDGDINLRRAREVAPAEIRRRQRAS